MAINIKIEVTPPHAGESAELIAKIRKDKGEKAIIKGSEVPNVTRIPTGIFELDLALGGGVPRGRLSIVYGPEGSGKSNVCYGLARMAQQLDPFCNKVVWVDLEGTFDPEWVKQFGINMDDLIMVKPSYGEEAVDYIDALIQANDISLVIVDSIAVMSAVKEVEQSTEKADVGTASLLVKRLCNKMAWAFGREFKRDHFPTVVFVNQTRYKIGVMFGDPETIPGGNAMRFMSSLTWRQYGKGKVDSKLHPTLPVVRDTNVVVKKAKVGIRAVETQYDLCVVSTGDLQVGDTASFGMVSNHLRQIEVVKKVTSGYEYEGTVFKTLDEMKKRYYAERAFADAMKDRVLQHVAATQKAFLVEATDAAK